MRGGGRGRSGARDVPEEHFLPQVRSSELSKMYAKSLKISI